MKVKRWHTQQLLSELEIYKPIFDRLGASISTKSCYYHRYHPRFPEVERVISITVRRNSEEYGFSIHEHRTKSNRCIWVDFNPVTRRKIDDTIRQIFHAACRNLIAQIARDIILQYDPQLYRTFYCIVTEEQLTITFMRSFVQEHGLSSGELIIPLEQLSEQLLQEVLPISLNARHVRSK